MGLLITIEANDGSGKETQSKRLLKRLTDEGYPVRLVSFPNYESESSALVKMYLKGDFGQNADDVSPFASSVFFAVDRFASYKKEWSDFYAEGGIVIADRYTTANMVHQSTKFESVEEVDKFLMWLENFEYELMGIPRPDLTFFLDVPVEHSIAVIEKRANKIDGSEVKDIHERDHSHLSRAYEASKHIGELFGWHRIECMLDREFRPIDAIHEDIYRVVGKLLKERFQVERSDV
ncbi:MULTISPECIES: thymidylate kinase [unclassified Fusibacter]|uniref:dTMP kinase n=1 Tax=unclassified Fusibacter TaxID=2624464 RepID=UPI001012FBB9|nr:MULTISPECIES: thymidylate kinase [unclassified Fusibacter]MCK8059215.1 thymidylate kinase [Fusibacter sp. A2]NPE21321.1 thymidylate kinase [Fusibacter sp. A1]RXV62584.1 thymidylate kinase [Fusibacter sp. A1]